MRSVTLLALSLSLCAEEPLLRIPAARAAVEIDHQPIAIVASGAVFRGDGPDTYRLALSVDLADLQEHATDILRAHLDKNDACGERMHILHASLEPSWLTVEMHFEKWACVKALGKKIEKRLVGGDAKVRVELTPVVDAAMVRLDAEVRDVQADGSLGELLKSAEVREKIKRSVQSSLDRATDFRGTLPRLLADVVQLRAVRFVEPAPGGLGLAIDADAGISPEQMRELRGALRPQPRPQP